MSAIVCSPTVIIPSKNLDNLVPCVKAIRENESALRVVWVMDADRNGGYDYPDEGLSKLYSTAGTRGCVFAFGEKPFIFSRNINIGIKQALYLDPDLCGVVLLNDDALLKTPNGFTDLAKCAVENPEYGVIAAVTNNVGNQDQLQQGIGLREEKRMVCFVCVYIPRRTIETVGLLDERFYHYGMDDDDYCKRVMNAGLKIGIHDGCFVDHASLKSSYRTEGTSFITNMKIFIQKWGTDNWGNKKEASPWAELF